MRFKTILCGLLLLFSTVLAACTSDSSLGRSEKELMVDHVKAVEESEFDLIYFNKSYKQYLKVVNEIVSEAYWVSMSDEIVFGYDGATYTRDDLANMSQGEYDNHKEHMLNLIRGTDMDNVSVTIRISDVYEGDQSNQVNIYTIENKELIDRPLTATAKKYTLEKYSGKWLIADVEQDKFTYGSEQTAKNAEEGIKSLKYQTHEGKVVGYPTVIVLSGAGK
ncbi:hypothetical protein M6D81_13760 [Paenibacillus sp. J5C_2022]|uniref:Rz1-like spanin outer membrane subunit n=1 Tax=Paenibacillus sp. J5C2022 TaxID=2977129 RepID=UPI0021CFA805|nr:Rz1-like spanin outer membrane subunit [Paenibacillus sp. J5C2022]MCU6709764.1 hypothetical protein [Paenibacillus sp. J5C2022]